MITGEKNNNFQDSSENPGPSIVEISSELHDNTDKVSNPETQNSSTESAGAVIIDISSDSDDDRDYYYGDTFDSNDISVIDTVKTDTALSGLLSQLNDNRSSLNQVVTSSDSQVVNNQIQDSPKIKISEESNNDILYGMENSVLFKRKRLSKSPKPGCSKDSDDASYVGKVPPLEGFDTTFYMKELRKNANIIHALLPKKGYNLIYKTLCNNRYARNYIELTLWDLLPEKRPVAQYLYKRRSTDDVCPIECKKNISALQDKMNTKAALEKKEQARVESEIDVVNVKSENEGYTLLRDMIDGMKKDTSGETTAQKSIPLEVDSKIKESQSTKNSEVSLKGKHIFPSSTSSVTSRGTLQPAKLTFCPDTFLQEDQVDIKTTLEKKKQACAGNNVKVAENNLRSRKSTSLMDKTEMKRENILEEAAGPSNADDNINQQNVAPLKVKQQHIPIRSVQQLLVNNHLNPYTNRKSPKKSVSLEVDSNTKLQLNSEMSHKKDYGLFSDNTPSAKELQMSFLNLMNSTNNNITLTIEKLMQKLQNSKPAASKILSDKAKAEVDKFINSISYYRRDYFLDVPLQCPSEEYLATIKHYKTRNKILSGNEKAELNRFLRFLCRYRDSKLPYTGLLTSSAKIAQNTSDQKANTNRKSPKKSVSSKVDSNTKLQLNSEMSHKKDYGLFSDNTPSIKELLMAFLNLMKSTNNNITLTIEKLIQKLQNSKPATSKILSDKAKEQVDSFIYFITRYRRSDLVNLPHLPWIHYKTQNKILSDNEKAELDRFLRFLRRYKGSELPYTRLLTSSAKIAQNTSDQKASSSKANCNLEVGNMNAPQVCDGGDEKQIDTMHVDLLMIFPEADPVYLREVAEKIDPKKINEFVQSKLERPDYPTRAQNLAKKKITEQQKQYTTDFQVLRFLKIFPDPFAYFEDDKRKCHFSEFAMAVLRHYFNEFKIDTLVYVYRRVWQYNLSLTVKTLEMLYPDMENKRYCNEITLLTEDIPLLQEYSFIKHKAELRKYLDEMRAKEKQEFNELKAKNKLLECQYCYDNECMPSKCSTCEGGHIFCISCIVRRTDVVLADGNTHVDCLLSCGCEFPISVLQRVLPPTKFNILLCKRQEAEVMAAEIEGLVSCPFCHFASIPPEDKIFKCLNPECLKESCRLCKELNHIPLTCNEKKRSC